MMIATTTETPPVTDAPPGADDRTKLRALLVVNPRASGMTPKRERTVVRMLREELDVEVARTSHAGHASAIAGSAVGDADIDVVFTCGGDGTANEVVNGMQAADRTAQSLPLVAILPAGATNVIMRSVGLPNHPVKAVSHLLEALRLGRSHTINLGRVDERAFLFAAGIGFDAAIVKRMAERRRGRRPSDVAHLVAMVAFFAYERLRLEDSMTVTIDGTDESLRCSLLMCGNASPFTYMGRVPVQLTPAAQLDRGLDFLAPHRCSVAFALRVGLQAMGVLPGRGGERLDRRLQAHTDIDAFSVSCDDPMPVQLDGEYIGDRTQLRFSTLHEAVRLVY